MTSSKKPGQPDTVAYSLEFNVQAKKEWDKLSSTIRLQFAKKLKERLINPNVDSDKLRDMPGCYKIKLRSIGYRLVYEVLEDRVVVAVIAVGKRDRSTTYIKAAARLGKRSRQE